MVVVVLGRVEGRSEGGRSELQKPPVCLAAWPAIFDVRAAAPHGSRSPGPVSSWA
ncbi:hypothetical protein chiPu_0022286, partial [Chiloscyllium punctatum]|nr:hypothetical protein [Chiloscyllium punctatum]